MFTGIIETLGVVRQLQNRGDNIDFTIDSAITNELKIDQSVSHNGVCLTVVSIDQNLYKVTAIAETLQKTNLGDWKAGDRINLERAMKFGDRLDGHIVQGHVDQTALCIAVADENGSWRFTFRYDANQNNITIEKGSITINGVSLTVVDSKDSEFSVAIIPYTFEHTNFNTIVIGTKVNLEFDVIGKYIARLYALRN